MSDIDKHATELLIENGVLVADTLRHLADNEIDSDYFVICHTNENGTEIECELAITDYARQAAGTVDELVKALEAAEKRIAELSASHGNLLRGNGWQFSQHNHGRRCLHADGGNSKFFQTRLRRARLLQPVKESEHGQDY